MKSFVAACLAATSAVAAPLVSRQSSSNIDPVVLQFALTLEHLENAFYKQALSNYSSSAFTAAGFPSDYYNNLKYIAYDEQSHVDLLTGALKAAGANPVQPCTYKFPSTDAKSFVTLSSIIEGVGTSAYLGGAPLITSKSYLTVAGSILVTEALHTSYQRAAIKEVPFANPYGTPIDPTSAYSIAAAFIVSCPSSNYALPFTAFPGLTYSAPSSGKCSAGSYSTFTATKAIPAGSYVTFVSGLNVISVMGTISGNSISATVPAAVSGQSYVFLSSSNQTGTYVDTAVLAGPAIIEVAPPAL